MESESFSPMTIIAVLIISVFCFGSCFGLSLGVM